MANHAIGEEGFATSRRTEDEEVAIVGNLVLAFLAADVDGHWHSLAVCIIDFERSVLMVLNMLLVHQTSGCIAQRQETVIVGVHAVAVAWERVHEQLQLVVGSLADVHAHAAKGVLQMVGAFLNILVDGQRHHDVEVGIDKLLVLSGNHILHLLDVLPASGSA